MPQNTVSDIVTVCQGPSHLAFRRYTDPFGGPARNRVYVLCYSANQMAVVDPDRAQLVDQVLVGTTRHLLVAVIHLLLHLQLVLIDTPRM